MSVDEHRDSPANFSARAASPASRPAAGAGSIPTQRAASRNDGDDSRVARSSARPITGAEILAQYAVPASEHASAGDLRPNIPGVHQSKFAPTGVGPNRPYESMGFDAASFARNDEALGGIRPIYDPPTNKSAIVPKRVRVNRAKFHYERHGAPDSVVMADREDRLSDTKAAEVLSAVHAEFGLLRESAELLKAFDDAMFLYVALNQTSAANNARGSFYVHDVEYEFHRVLRIVGPFPRKFFRAYADEIRAVIVRVLANESSDDDCYAMAESVRQTAHARGMSRYPTVCFDVADHCSDLSAAERAAIRMSANAVISATANAVDEVVVSRPTALEDDEN